MVGERWIRHGLACLLLAAWGSVANAQDTPLFATDRKVYQPGEILKLVYYLPTERRGQPTLKVEGQIGHAELAELPDIKGRLNSNGPGEVELVIGSELQGFDVWVQQLYGPERRGMFRGLAGRSLVTIEADLYGEDSWPTAKVLVLNPIAPFDFLSVEGETTVIMGDPIRAVVDDMPGLKQIAKSWHWRGANDYVQLRLTTRPRLLPGGSETHTWWSDSETKTITPVELPDTPHTEVFGSYRIGPHVLELVGPGDVLLGQVELEIVPPDMSQSIRIITRDDGTANLRFENSAKVGRIDGQIYRLNAAGHFQRSNYAFGPYPYGPGHPLPGQYQWRGNIGSRFGGIETARVDFELSGAAYNDYGPPELPDELPVLRFSGDTLYAPGEPLRFELQNFDQDGFFLLIVGRGHYRQNCTWIAEDMVLGQAGRPVVNGEAPLIEAPDQPGLYEVRVYHGHGPIQTTTSMPFAEHATLIARVPFDVGRPPADNLISVSSDNVTMGDELAAEIDLSALRMLAGEDSVSVSVDRNAETLFGGGRTAHVPHGDNNFGSFDPILANAPDRVTLPTDVPGHYRVVFYTVQSQPQRSDDRDHVLASADYRVTFADNIQDELDEISEFQLANSPHEPVPIDEWLLSEETCSEGPPGVEEIRIVQWHANEVDDPDDDEYLLIDKPIPGFPYHIEATVQAGFSRETIEILTSEGERIELRRTADPQLYRSAVIALIRGPEE